MSYPIIATVTSYNDTTYLNEVEYLAVYADSLAQAIEQIEEAYGDCLLEVSVRWYDGGFINIKEAYREIFGEEVVRG